ncbi:lysozyme inhibitor LprI family protein [Croceicoccus mobilis]|uniref:Lysozyme inhibitor LprI-like N-terminal domain-containing protein n=1 Tax=Croceicoccus mobilis TaxID=1703339 RepID=A0A917DXE8_9SPHN|nr:lysozyme inhibitor LprI family protein [Croceicoccus mobilis]GGD77966.1 hypothetical protein GCM10010990_29690 [Croceicoccus mobilis]
MMLSLLLLAAAQAASPCDNAMTQADMNQCSMEEYEAADGALNAAWADARAQAKASGTYDSLLTAQRAWIAFRDAHCKAVAAPYAGGSILPLIHNRCMTRLTQTRTAQLREMAETN